MSNGLIEKIKWKLDDLESYTTELQDMESKKNAEYIIGSVRDFLNDIESEIDDINRCLERIV